jgi:hypothetical protein
MKTNPELTKRNECYSCKHKVNIPKNTHIGCNKPDINIKGDIYAIERGWFIYPLLFDPRWKLNNCKNFEKVQEDIF